MNVPEGTGHDDSLRDPHASAGVSWPQGSGYRRARGRRRAGSASGFTLVELLIAIAIFGMVMGIATYGYALYTRHWSGQLGSFERAQAQQQRVDLLMQALQNTLPYMVRDADDLPGFYFLGRDEGLTLVTSSPVFSPGELAVIRVFREPAGNGRWNLVYEEAPLTGVLLRRADQTLPFRHRMVVLRDLGGFEFAYFGWDTVEHRLAAADAVDTGHHPQWFTSYDGLRQRLHPERVAMKLPGGEAVIFVPERIDQALRSYAAVE
jgi:prepilin-type N-terminal cleavage/methylation domain-containing protein